MVGTARSRGSWCAAFLAIVSLFLVVLDVSNALPLGNCARTTLGVMACCFAFVFCHAGAREDLRTQYPRASESELMNAIRRRIAELEVYVAADDLASSPETIHRARGGRSGGATNRKKASKRTAAKKRARKRQAPEVREAVKCAMARLFSKPKDPRVSPQPVEGTPTPAHDTHTHTQTHTHTHTHTRTHTHAVLCRSPT